MKAVITIEDVSTRQTQSKFVFRQRSITRITRGFSSGKFPAVQLCKWRSEITTYES